MALTGGRAGGARSDEHWDWFDKDEMEKLKMGNSNRVATVLMYLSGERPRPAALQHICLHGFWRPRS